MIWVYAGERYTHFLLYRARVLAEIAQDVENLHYPWPWLRKTLRLPSVAATRQRSRRWPSRVMPLVKEGGVYANH